jgi:DNA polymerase-3 subunit gamma/tau
MQGARLSCFTDMSYLVLARKYRPKTFADIVGQKPVVTTLVNSLTRGRVAHAILFSGIRGVGKTTLARIMAKALNCITGPTPTPCNTCDSCTQINTGASLDLHEIDGASNRGIQEVRDLKDNIKYMPAAAPHKIVIIDEVHMLTNEAFNALLKTLEEPPEHVYFIFATTELHKIPITILSRCQRFELRRINSTELAEHYEKLAAAEGIILEKGALNLIVRESEGSVRDGLSLLDQVFAYGSSPVTENDVVEVLGLVDRTILATIAEALLSGNRQRALSILGEAADFGLDGKRFVADLLSHYRALLLVRLDGCEKLLDLPADDIEACKAVASRYPAQIIHHQLRILMNTADRIRLSTQPRLLLETTFLAMAETDSMIDVQTLLREIDSIVGALPDASPADDAGPSDNDETASSETVKPEKKKKSEDRSRHETEPAPRETTTPPAAVADMGVEGSQLTKPAPEPEHIDAWWPDFLKQLHGKKRWMAQNLEQAKQIDVQGQEITLTFAHPSDFTLLKNSANVAALKRYLHDLTGKEYEICLIAQHLESEPGSSNGAETTQTYKKLANHPAVRMAEDIFGGHVSDIRVHTVPDPQDSLKPTQD